jgi:hypothetical protein
MDYNTSLYLMPSSKQIMNVRNFRDKLKRYRAADECRIRSCETKQTGSILDGRQEYLKTVRNLFCDDYNYGY